MSDDHLIEQVGRVWQSSANLSLFYEAAGYLPQTLVSALVSRRYSIDLHIKSCEHGHASLVLQVTPRVLYETFCLPCSFTGEISMVPSESSNDMGAPPGYFPWYVRKFDRIILICVKCGPPNAESSFWHDWAWYSTTVVMYLKSTLLCGVYFQPLKTL
jgi:hypothetical protein